MANIWEKAILNLVGNLNAGLSYLITTIFQISKGRCEKFLSIEVKTRRISKAPETQIRTHSTANRKFRVALIKKSISRKNWFNSGMSSLASKEEAGDTKSKESANHSGDKKYIINGKIRIPQMVSKIGILRRYQIQ